MLRLPLVANLLLVMSLLSNGRSRRKLFLIPEHLNNYEIQYLWFPSVVCTYLNVNVFHYNHFEVSPSLPHPPPPRHPVVSPLSLLLIHRPSHPIPQFSAVLSHLTQATTKYNIYL